MKELRAIFYSEFDIDTGPVLLYQEPKCFLNSQQFDAIAEYVITKNDLCGKLVAISHLGYQIMGFPVRIEDVKYPRHALLFNLGVVLDETANPAPYEPIVRKLASILTTLEMESDFLFDVKKKSQLDEILHRIFHDLKRQGEAIVPVDEGNTIRLKLFPSLSDPCPIHDYQVPVPVCDLSTIVSQTHDLTFKQILRHIDGTTYVARISNDSNVQIALVKQCLQHLVYFGAVKMIDVFQYSNIYVTTPLIRKLADDAHLQADCLQYITKTDQVAPPFHKVFAMYCGLQPNVRFSQFLNSNDLSALNIDDKKFIMFGVIHGFLRRIHKYPIRMGSSLISEQVTDLSDRISKYLDGFARHSYDEICCAVSRSHSEIDGILRQEKRCLVINK